MSGTATVTALPFVVSADALAAHQCDLDRRQKEQDAKRDLLRSCLNPAFAAKLEAEKPVYMWHVKASFDYVNWGKLEGVSMDQRVVAQNENDAWAKCCDTLEVWPSRRDARPVFKRLKQLDVAEVTAGVQGDSLAETPRRKLVPKRKSTQSL